ncbi:hypothetical protein CDAR_411451 [Caerostris darwini]|uniref:Uncharacterized protein n=1 Tax=Caerostris darwini TaxID=1538125 RepID=A0AAV4SHV6_9ARAC|nr:hypothetical protein CDAR_411451 [Caerostris darwini]
MDVPPSNTALTEGCGEKKSPFPGEQMQGVRTYLEPNRCRARVSGCGVWGQEREIDHGSENGLRGTKAKEEKRFCSMPDPGELHWVESGQDDRDSLISTRFSHFIMYGFRRMSETRL